MNDFPFAKAEALTLLGNMIRIRRLEEKSAEKYSEGKIRGFLHLYIGEEAIAVGAMHVLRPEDNVLTTYREHAHALMRGLTADRIMAEMYGKSLGCSRGRGGSMHLFDVEKRFYGGSAIVAAHIPLAVGMALGDKMRGRVAVTACFFGEGAMAEGAFHESMNLAALWKVPALFLCENNYYAMGTALERSEALTDLCAKARSYNVPAESVDGMDVASVVASVRGAADAVRKGAGPRFVELRTYRFRSHSMFDPELYRPKSEVEECKKRDPLELFALRMAEAGLLTEDERAQLTAAAEAEIEGSVAFAESAAWEPREDLARFLYAREEQPHG